MTHPPIPPNCRYFTGTADGLFLDLTYEIEGQEVCDVWAPLDHFFYRPVIAAVAEVAWREEADRLSEQQEKNTTVEIPGFGPLYLFGRESPEETTALDNAASWRAWGKGAWKP